MTYRRHVWLVFGALLALLPGLLPGSPWDPNRPRPAGFQRTLGYLDANFYNYPDAHLQSTRSKMLGEDLVDGLIAKLKSNGVPQSSWEAEGQKAVDYYSSQYEAMKTLIRQTMNDPEGIIRAVEGNQPIAAELVAHPNVRSLITFNWARLTSAEQTYQIHLYVGGDTGGNRPPARPQDVVPPKPGKSQNRIDWERTRETWRRAIERRRAFEAKLAEQNRKRIAEILELIRYLQNHGAFSENKFRANRPGSGGFIAGGTPEPTFTDPATGAAAEPAAPIAEIEQLQEKMEELEAMLAPAEKESTPAEPTKVKIYCGSLVLHRQPDWPDTLWSQIKQLYLAAHANIPGVTLLEDAGGQVSWSYRMLDAPKPADWIEIEPGTDCGEGEPPRKKDEEEPKPEGNGDATPGGTTVPGTEQPVETVTPPAKPVAAAQPAAKPAPKPETPKPEPNLHDGYWYDPSDRTSDDDDPTIYVRLNGQAVSVKLSQAGKHGVPDVTIDQMSWYSEKFKKVVEDRKTHRPKRK